MDSLLDTNFQHINNLAFRELRFSNDDNIWNLVTNCKKNVMIGILFELVLSLNQLMRGWNGFENLAMGEEVNNLRNPNPRLLTIRNFLMGIPLDPQRNNKRQQLEENGYQEESFLKRLGYKDIFPLESALNSEITQPTRRTIESLNPSIRDRLNLNDIRTFNQQLLDLIFEVHIELFEVIRRKLNPALIQYNQIQELNSPIDLHNIEVIRAFKNLLNNEVVISITAKSIFTKHSFEPRWERFPFDFKSIASVITFYVLDKISRYFKLTSDPDLKSNSLVKTFKIHKLRQSIETTQNIEEICEELRILSNLNDRDNRLKPEIFSFLVRDFEKRVLHTIMDISYQNLINIFRLTTIKKINVLSDKSREAFHEFQENLEMTQGELHQEIQRDLSLSRENIRAVGQNLLISDLVRSCLVRETPKTNLTLLKLNPNLPAEIPLPWTAYSIFSFITFYRNRFNFQLLKVMAQVYYDLFQAVRQKYRRYL